MIGRCEWLLKIINIKKSGIMPPRDRRDFPHCLLKGTHCPAEIKGLQALFLEKNLYLELFLTWSGLEIQLKIKKKTKFYAQTLHIWPYPILSNDSLFLIWSGRDHLKALYLHCMIILHKILKKRINYATKKPFFTAHLSTSYLLFSSVSAKRGFRLINWYLVRPPLPLVVDLVLERVAAYLRSPVE